MTVDSRVTECQRIVESGLLSPNFLNPEVRNDFLVDTNRKKLWAVLLDLICKLDDVCNTYGLKYFLVEGSLLGAVRHSGFVPWDDDVDIAMPRDDYDELIELSGEFSHPYFLQTPYTDKGYYYSNIRIRNSNTTFIQDVFRYQPINHGIFIDVLPIDNWDCDGGKERYNRINELNIENSTAMRLSNPYLSDKDKLRVSTYTGTNPLKTYEEIQMLATQSNSKITEYLALAVDTVYGYPHHVFFCDDFRSALHFKFEKMEFPVPIGYNRILKTVYGDWNTFPPLEKRGGWHNKIECNPDLPYRTTLSLRQNPKSSLWI